MPMLKHGLIQVVESGIYAAYSSGLFFVILFIYYFLRKYIFRVGCLKRIRNFLILFFDPLFNVY